MSSKSLPCPKCGALMVITRRTPHPEQGPDYEQQTFECGRCANESVRTVDRDGNSPP